MMLQQTTWKKALKLGMKKTFTLEELLTSVPTERGARMSKQGKKALDQEKLAAVKGTLKTQHISASCFTSNIYDGKALVYKWYPFRRFSTTVLCPERCMAAIE